jgi:ATP-binding cassette subfamily F protein 3
MIALDSVTLRRGTKVVLEKASAVVQPGEKVGLVGRNGAGKSSLFSLLAGRLQSDAGDATIPPTWRIAEVAQEMPETDEPATDFVLAGDRPLAEAEALLAAALDSGDGHAIAEAHEAIGLAGGFDARPRAEAMLLGLGFRRDELDKPVSSFSGGWRMRLQLARALMAPAELLMLDEPTNHLDLDALVWLESWLQRFPCTLIVISHDREFLDAITRVTLHLEHAALARYGGNHSAFEELRAARLSQQAAQHAKQQERIAHLQKFIARFKAKASKATQAQSRVKALARMERIAPVLTDSDFAFEFREPDALPNPMLAFDGVRMGYATERPIVALQDRSVLAGQRLGILGANGQGKSTLVKTIAGDLAPLAGRVVAGKGLRIGYFAQQELDVLSPADGPLMHMVRLARDHGPAAREQELRDFLGRFRFTGEMAAQPVQTLSGGEKARLVLAMIVWQRPNLLLLDEPTNHLDLQTRDALGVALNEFEGTVLLVSHDRSLLRTTCDAFWLVRDGGVHPFDGDIDDYQRWLADEAKRRAAASSAAASAAAPAAASGAARKEERRAEAQARQKRADAAKPLRAEANRIDNRLGVLHAERDALEASFADAALDADALAENGRRLKTVAAEIERLESRWLELSTQIDAMAAAG